MNALTETIEEEHGFRPITEHDLRGGHIELHQKTAHHLCMNAVLSEHWDWL
jgi:hypothetical protein